MADSAFMSGSLVRDRCPESSRSLRLWDRQQEVAPLGVLLRDILLELKPRFQWLLDPLDNMPTRLQGVSAKKRV